MTELPSLSSAPRRETSAVRKIFLVGLVLLFGGAVGADWALGRAAQALLARVEASLPEGAHLTHGGLSTNLFRLRVALDTVDYTSPQGGFKAQRAVLHGIPQISPDVLSLGGVELQDAVVESPGMFSASVGRLVVDDPVLHPPSPARPHPSVAFTSLEGARFATRQEFRSASVTLESFRLTDLDAEALARLEVQGLALSAPNAQGTPTALRLDRAVVEGFDLALLKETSVATLLQRLFLLNSLRGVRVEGLNLTQNSDPVLSVGRFLWDGRAGAGGESSAGAGRTALGVSAEGLRVGAVLLPPEVKSVVTSLGRAVLEADGRFDARLDPVRKTLTVDPVRLSLPGVGSLTFKGVLGRVDSTATLASGLASAFATVDRLELTVEDLGGLGSFIRNRAAAQGMSPDLYARSLVDQLLGTANGTDGGLDVVRRNLISFLAGGKDLAVVAQPTEPVSLLQLLMSAKNKGVLIGKLGLSVKATPSPAR